MPSTKVTPAKVAPKAPAKVAPKAPAKVAPKAPAKASAPLLRVWVSGRVVGVNHSQGANGSQRYKVPATVAWEGTVWGAVYGAAHTANLIGAPAWNLPRQETADPNEAVPLGVRLHFFTLGEWNTLKKSGERVLKKLDVDAPSKLTLDAVMRALALDDNAVRVLEVAQTVLSEDLPQLPGGYGKTRQGCWVEVWRLSPTERKRLNAVVPGTPS